MAWMVCVVLLAILLAWEWRTEGPSVALGVAFLYSLLIPTWISIDIAGLPLNVRTAVASIGLVAYCFHPKAVFQTKLTAPDYAVIALACVQVLSDTLNDGFSLQVPLLAYGEWIIPFLVGRVAFQTSRDVRKTATHACVIAIVLAIWAATESIGGTNPAEWVFSKRPVDRTPFGQIRWGLTRAEGPTIHPIWFGMLQALLLPWTMSAAVGALHREGSIWKLAAPAGTWVGVFFSLSRGPVALALLATYFVPLCFLKRRMWRRVAIGGSLVLGVAAYAAIGTRGLHYLSEGPRQTRVQTRVVDGESVEYNGTTHRLLVLSVYREPMIKAGLIGFGTERTNTFPVRVPMGVLDPKTMSTVWTIDNHFIIVQLRLGLAGVLSVLFLLVFSAVSALRTAAAQPPEIAVFSNCVGVVLLVMPLILMAEWMPHDYGFVLLVLTGCSSGLRSLTTGNR